MFGRVLRLAAVGVVGVALAIAGYVAYQVVTSPRAREDTRDWQLLASLETARGETAAAVANGQLYVLGGLTGLALQATAEVSRYDSVTDAWERLPDLPDARHHAAAASLDGIVYLSGGGSQARADQATLWSYSSGAEAWSELSPMPHARFAHRMLAVGRRLFVVGGTGGAPVLIYDPEADSWSSGAPMPDPRHHLAAVVVGREIWAIGGRMENQVQDRVDIYDTRTDAWRPGPALPRATSAATEGVVDGVIYISGGEDPANDRMVDAHWLLDTNLGRAAEWEQLAPPPLTVHGAHGAVIGDRFLMAAGASRPGGSSRFAWSGLLQAYRPPG